MGTLGNGSGRVRNPLWYCEPCRDDGVRTQIPTRRYWRTVERYGSGLCAPCEAKLRAFLERAFRSRSAPRGTSAAS